MSLEKLPLNEQDQGLGFGGGLEGSEEISISVNERKICILRRDELEMCLLPTSSNNNTVYNGF